MGTRICMGISAGTEKLRFRDELFLVLAAWMDHRQDHEVRMRKQPLFRLGPCAFCCANHGPQVLIAGEGLEMIDADPGNVGDFILGKELLARSDSNHLCTPR